MVALGVDVGSTNTKVSLVSVSELTVDELIVDELAVASAPTPSDATELIAVVHSAISQVVPVSPRAPDVVGLASMAESGVPLDAWDLPLCEILRWNGERGQQEAEQLASQLGREQLFEATGVRPSAKVPLVVWRWLRNRRPAVWRTMDRWAGMADLLCLSMTGRLATDHTLAGRTMAYRLPEHGMALADDFDPDLLAEVDMLPEQLPEVVQPGGIAGRVTSADFLGAGLHVNTPVVISGHDHPVGAWAAGLRRAGQVADSVGTAEAMLTLLDPAAEHSPVDRPAVASAGMSLVRAVDGTHEALVAGSATAGGLCDWWLREVARHHDVDAVLAAVASLPTEPSGVVFLPFLSGRQAPAPDSSARVRIYNPHGATLSIQAALADDVALFTKAMYEGVSLQARWMETEQRRLARLTPAEQMVVLVGSGARRGPWMAIKNAVTPQRLSAVAAQEPVASGAALLAACRVGLLDAEQAVLRTDPWDVQPTSKGEDRYQDMFHSYRRAALAPHHPG